MALDGAAQRLVTLGHDVVVHGRASSVPRRRCVACPAPALRWQVISLASNKPVLSRRISPAQSPSPPSAIHRDLERRAFDISEGNASTIAELRANEWSTCWDH